MISFACRTIDFEELFSCSFGLKKTDYKIFNIILQSGKRLTVSSIAKILGKERTVVQKSVKSLLEKRLVKRYQENIQNGGYRFYYEAEDKEEIRKRLLEIIRRWSSNVEDVVSKW
ncbi:MAG: helix-turn-helix domain-containing protein [Candidatus Woesearchaeota archaeon]